MKLTCLFLLLFAVQLSAKSFSQHVVNVSGTNKTLKEVMREIKSQTGVYFMYNNREVNASMKVSVDLKGVSLESALREIFKSLPYVYDMINGYVLVVPRVTGVKDTLIGKKEVKGIVLDQKGESIPGVSIMIKGTGLGTVTDVDGKFKLEMPNRKDVVLLFSFVGMEKKEIKADTIFMRVVLKESVEQMAEVVITGYQEIDRRKLSSSVMSVRGADMLETSSISIDGMLQGRLAGVAVLNQTSTPGAAPKIRIRGSSSITGNREPVWVVDGMVLDEPVTLSPEELNSLDKVNLIGNAIAGINPSDIERIDILKDASATAIYGVKAANGVIVVTTKKGVTGKARVSYSGSISITSRPNYDDMYLMDSKERIEVSEEMHKKGLQFSTYLPTSMAYEGALKKLWDKDISYDQFRQEVKELKEVNTDWYSLLFRTAVSTQHSVSVSGANERTNYYFSVGYANQQSVTKTEDMDRYTAMMKVSSRITDYFRVGFKMDGSLAQTRRPHSSVDLYQYAYNTSRAIPAYDVSGELFYYDNAYSIANKNLPFNILNELQQSGTKVSNQSLNVNLTVDWDIFRWLKFSSMVATGLNNNYQTYWACDRSFYISKLRGIPYGEALPEKISGGAWDKIKVPMGGELKNEDTRNLKYVVRNSISLLEQWGKHGFSAIVGSEIASSKYDGVSTVQWGYLPERGKTFAVIDQERWPAYAKMVRENPDKITDRLTNTISWYGAFTYSYDDLYILNFNIRTDGSNKFGQDKSVRFLPIWSVSGRWNMHNESFMKDNRWINEFALRASYGIQGNVHPDQTPALIVKMGSVDAISQEYSSTLYKLPNGRLKWEKTKSYNLALDASFLDGRIGGTMELYRKKGVDQIVDKIVAPSTGANRVAINAGNLENKGWELSLNFLPIRSKDWTWSLSFNTSKNYNKVTDAGDQQGETWNDYINGTLVRDGKAVNSFYSYRFKELDSQGLPVFYGQSEKDETGKSIVQSQQEAYDLAFVYCGRREPDLTGGISTNIRFRNFSLNGLFSFSLGNKVRLNDLYLSGGQTLPFPQQNMSSEFVNRWREPGDEVRTNIPVLSDNGLTSGLYGRRYPIANDRWEMYNKSDLRVMKGDFLRCRSLSIRYNIDSRWLKRISCQSASLSLDMSNLFVLKSSGLKGRDPEQLTMGSRTVPPLRGYALSLNVVF